MESPEVFLSVIIPAYNEETRIEHTVRAVDAYLSRQPYSYELLVIDDGSKDRTTEVVQGLDPYIANLRLLRYMPNRGKGYAVHEGMLDARGEIRLFMDADNSTSIDQIERMLPEFKVGCEVVIGSRRVPGAKIAVHQNFIRENLGRVFNLLVRLLAGLPMADTQAGFKAFSGRAAKEIFSRQTIWRFAFDVEILTLAQALGFKVKEVPITWINDAKTRLHLGGMITMLLEVIQVRWNVLRGLYRRRMR